MEEGGGDLDVDVSVAVAVVQSLWRGALVVTGVLMALWMWLWLWFRVCGGENGGDLCLDVTVVAIPVVQGLWEENGGDRCVDVTEVAIAVVQLFVGGRMVVTCELMSPWWLWLWFSCLWGENGGDL